ncbi:MAG: DUF1428 family protein [Blastocatellia bacterium]|nr:DUF1428 family protein [Blastocatellia bacterium]
MGHRRIPHDRKTKPIKLKPGENVIYAAVEFKSEPHRNKAMKAIMSDSELDGMAACAQLFNFKRMVYGGFKISSTFNAFAAGGV